MTLNHAASSRGRARQRRAKTGRVEERERGR